VQNAKRRPREYLTVKEAELLLASARDRGRYGHRDATMILSAYRHGLRASELCALRWAQIDFARGLLHVQRLKNGTPSVHPIGGTEMRALRRLKREQLESRHVFLTERRAPMTTAGVRGTGALWFSISSVSRPARSELQIKNKTTLRLCRARRRPHKRYVSTSSPPPHPMAPRR
jgi:type 1 fimbriae regulatory protein FimB/type 1 fimbriae regulatory protein FimE